MHYSSSDFSRFRLMDVVYGCLLTLLVTAVAWGAKELISIQPMREDMAMIKSWKDVAIQQMGNMDGKLDALIRAQGIRYTPRTK